MPAVLDRLAWRGVRVVSQLLEDRERDAVVGDLIELKLPAPYVLRAVVGLAVRRQAAHWVDVGPWVAFVTIVLPIGWLLSHLSLFFADSTASYVFLYVQHWTWGFLASPGARHDLMRVALGILLDALAVVAWAWTAGYALGQLSRRTAWLTSALLGLVVLVGAVGATTAARVNGFHDAVFSLPFYAVVFPRLVRVFLVLLPAWCGVRRSVAERVLQSRSPTVGAVGIVVITVVSAEPLEFWRNLVLLWPTAYLVTSALARRGRRPQANQDPGTCV
jgi:hypothetical protein